MFYCGTCSISVCSSHRWKINISLKLVQLALLCFTCRAQELCIGVTTCSILGVFCDRVVRS